MNKLVHDCHCGFKAYTLAGYLLLICTILMWPHTSLLIPRGQSEKWRILRSGCKTIAGEKCVVRHSLGGYFFNVSMFLGCSQRKMLLCFIFVATETFPGQEEWALWAMSTAKKKKNDCTAVIIYTKGVRSFATLNIIKVCINYSCEAL